MKGAPSFAPFDRGRNCFHRGPWRSPRNKVFTIRQNQMGANSAKATTAMSNPLAASLCNESPNNSHDDEDSILENLEGSKKAKKGDCDGDDDNNKDDDDNNNTKDNKGKAAAPESSPPNAIVDLEELKEAVAKHIHDELTRLKRLLQRAPTDEHRLAILKRNSQVFIDETMEMERRVKQKQDEKEVAIAKETDKLARTASLDLVDVKVLPNTGPPEFLVIKHFLARVIQEHGGDLSGATDCDNKGFLHNATKAIMLHRTVCDKGPGRSIKNHNFFSGQAGGRPEKHELSFNNAVVARLVWMVAFGPHDKPPRGKKNKITVPHATIRGMKSKHPQLHKKVMLPLVNVFVQHLNRDSILRVDIIERVKVGDWEHSIKQKVTNHSMFSSAWLEQTNPATRNSKACAGVFLPCAFLAAKIVPGFFEIMSSKLPNPAKFCLVREVNCPAFVALKSQVVCAIETPEDLGGEEQEGLQVMNI